MHTGRLPRLETSPRSLKGKIAFASNRDGDYEIFVMKADGSRLRQLTHNDRDDSSPDWSPNGLRIVFVREHARDSSTDNEDLWVMSSDGSAQRRLTRSMDMDEYQPEWSPNGKKIAFAFTSSVERAGGDVVTIGPGGRNRYAVVAQESSTQNESPSWSPNGRRIAYLETNDGVISSVKSCCGREDLRDTRMTTVAPGACVAHEWAPAGEQILFAALHRWPVYNLREHWPKILFGLPARTYDYGYSDDFDLFVVDADGDRRFSVEGRERSNSYSGSWSPDGSSVAFYSDRGGSLDIYVTDLGGRNVFRLTQHPGKDIQPAWCCRQAGANLRILPKQRARE